MWSGYKMEEQFIGEQERLLQQMGQIPTQGEKPKKNYLFYITVILLILFVVYMTVKEDGSIEKSVEKSVNQKNISQVKIIIEIKKIGNETNLSKYNLTNVQVNRSNITRNISK